MKKGSPFLIIAIAVIIVAVVSLLPLSKWTGGRIKDFSLVSDILKEVGIMEGTRFLKQNRRATAPRQLLFKRLPRENR